ncbi:MAG: cytochrome c oxidase subunit 3 [Luteolibacter sp.]
MEIPYIVTPRKDTGLFNSKIAIWLFLASEVMLFGGFFSAYVFLRLGADYPWPERTLPVLPGLINTFVLIGSSVTVVFAWASLKMRQWRRFQIFMGITVFCALIFMVLKGVEYNVKFHHQALRLKDYTVIEGHLGKEKDESGKEVLNHHGDTIEENLIYVETTKLTFNTVRFYKPWIEELLTQAEHHKSSIKLAADVKAVTKEGLPAEVIAKAGEPLSIELLNKIQKTHLAARSHNGAMRTAALRSEWKTAKTANPDKKGWQLAPNVNIDAAALAPRLLDEVSSVAFTVEPATKFDFKPRDIKEADGSSVLRDDTVVEGKLLESPMVFHHIDAIDFQYLVMKSVQKGIDPEVAIENSWLMKNSPFVQQAWKWHLVEMDKLKKELAPHHREPTHKELYRLGWKDLARMAEEEGGAKISAVEKFKEEFLGPNYDARGAETFPEFSVPREEVGFSAKFTPAWNTYYAIYFTITGLHGLHVIGGALVLGYYLFFGKKMYLTNPEWLANRVEIGGLFWHFVDLVWIFVFPILYLM